jgi:hypothetical protein
VAPWWRENSKEAYAMRTAKAKLALSERTFVCLACGM